MESGMADLNRFFTALSERMYKENNLSDVTYALCEADVKFRQFFLDFFFHDARLTAGEVTIERETGFKKSGRPDFCIWTRDGGLYVVEVKIYDGNHHFEQYHDILAENKGNGDNGGRSAWKRLGYIANYKEAKDVKIENGSKTADEACSRVATWPEFVDGLERYLGFDDPTIRGYVEYVKRVCPYDDFQTPEDWKISAKDFKAVAEFDKALENAIRQNGCTAYSRSTRDFASMQWIGHFFDWQLSGDAVLSCRGWIGAYYRQGGAVVCVEFEETLCDNRAICDRFRANVQNGVLRFYAPKADGLIVSENKGDEQPEVGEWLEKFLGMVLDSVKKGDCEIGVQLTEPTADPAGGLLPMKCLLRLLETRFLSSELTEELEKRGCEIALSSCREAEVPQSHCGRYFAITERRKDGCAENELCKAWVGVVYNPDCTRTDGSADGDGEFGKSPAFIVSIPEGCVFDKGQEGWFRLGEYKRMYCVIDNGKWECTFKEARKRLLEIVSMWHEIEELAGKTRKRM